MRGSRLRMLVTIGMLLSLSSTALAQDAAEPAPPVEPEPAAAAPEAAAPDEAAAPGAEPALESEANGAGAPPPAGEEAERFAKNTIYLEGLGAGLLYSINYERVVADAIGVRLGFSYISVSATATAGDTQAEASASVMFIPLTASYIGIDGLELGGGATIMYASGSAATIGAEASGSGVAPLANVLVGYRSHPDLDGGFNFRVGAMAFFGPGLGFSVEDPDAFGVLPYIYLSLGASF